MKLTCTFGDLSDWVTQALQRSVPSMGSTNSVYHDEIRLF